VEEVLQYASQTKTSLTRIMLDNMVVPLSNGDVDISMLKEAVRLVNGRFETEVFMTGFASLTCIVLFGLLLTK
jgi:nicotinate-nucleotide pyrophosphorylase (carboxylating)